MALPVVLQQLLMLLNLVVDRMWIAHIPEVGQLAFTASGICVPIIYMVLSLAELVGTGISPRVGWLLGEGRQREAEQTLGAMLALDLLVAIAAGAAIESFCPSLISIFGGSEQTAPLAETYLRISTPGNVLSIISTGLAPFLLVQGYAKRAAIVLGTGIVLNMVLDPVLIFLAGWGIAGAAWATTIAEATAALLAVSMICRGSGLKLRLSTLRPDWRMVAPCLALGVTPMAMMLAETLQMGVCNQVLFRLSGDAGVGAMALVIMLHDFLYFPVYGMAYGVQPVTSYNLGARKPQRTRQNVRLLIRSTLLWSAAVWAVMMLLTEPVVRLVIGDGPMLAYAVPMVRLSFVAFFAATTQFVCQSTLQAMNRAVATFWLGLSRSLLLLVPLIWLLPQIFSNYADAAVFLAQPVADVVVCIVTVVILLRAL